MELLFKSDHAVILDFPSKQSILFEKYLADKPDKADVFFLDTSSEAKKILNKKLFDNWQKIFSKKKNLIKELSLNDNYLFKGNNLLVLHSILPIFKNSIKLIYIDPPYNTGNSFVYKDKLSRASWLLFMKNRLEIAREFLQNDGIIFIQCDENEQAYLKIICDEIYGENCFLGAITVIMNPGGRDYRSLARTHEYLLVYGKTVDAQLYPLELDKEFKFHDQLGGFELRNLRNGNIRFHKGNRPNLRYPFYVDPKNKDEYGLHPVSIDEKKGWIEIYPKISQGVETVWRWGKPKASENITTDTMTSNLVARSSKDSFLIFEKYRKKTRLARSVWNETEFYTTKGTKHIKEMFDEAVFDYPKPELLMARIIDIATQKGDMVMDFFLGSGTTAAVAHKAGRQWIGIEQMEYIDTVTLPRLQKMLSGEQGGASCHYQWNGGGSFVYATLSPTNQFPYCLDDDQSNTITNQFYNLKNTSI